MLFRPRRLGRYRKIAEVLARHGFGAIVAELGIDPTLGFGRRQPEPRTRRGAAVHLRLAIEELGPTFIKFGQIASTRPEIMPPAFLDELSNLHDNVPPAPWEEVQALIEEELGAPLQQLFLAFDPEPIAAASLAQVHAALLPDRTQVVVKVQRPNIEKTIETDLSIMRGLARLADERLPWTRLYDPAGLAEEFSTALRSELDYRREARNAERFLENFAGEQHLYVPRVHWEYTTDRVLVQERIEGIKIDDIPGLEATGMDRDRIALHAARLFIQEVLIDGFFHADPHPGNMLVMPGEVIGLMDFGTVGYLDGSDRANLVRLYIAVIQFDVEAIIDQLIRMDIASPSVDQAGLQRDLRRLLRKYYGLALKEINASDLFAEIQPIIYAYRLRIPSDYWLLIKTLVVMEGVGKKLAPDFDVFAVSAPYVRRFLSRLWLPSSWGPSLLRSAQSWADLFVEVPKQSVRLLSRAERGELEFQVRIPALERSSNQLNQMANRVILAILVGTISIALALLIPTLDLTWPWSLPTWGIVLGFVLLLGLGLWLIISILRSNRK
jgi:ubiquinone biosynthesis protein